MTTSLFSAWVTATRWLARALTVGVFLLWSAFFLEHTQEWFIKPFPNLPPPKVCVGHGLHLLLLAGLLVSLRWVRLGAAWVAVSAFVFFVDKTGSRFPVFFGITVLPALLLLLCWWLDRRQSAKASAGNGD